MDLCWMDQVKEIREKADYIADEYGDALLSLCSLADELEYLSSEFETETLIEINRQYEYLKKHYIWEEETVEEVIKKHTRKILVYKEDDSWSS